MTLGRIAIRADLDVLDAIDDAARTAPALMATAYRRTVSRVKSRNLSRLRSLDPGPPRYPIRWKSERQRRAFFATNGFGNGIPYQRSGSLTDSYDLVIRTSSEGGILELTNNAPGAEFVIGDQQQPFHIDTGWEFIGITANRIQDDLTDSLIETWYTIADPFAGVPR